MQAIARRHRRFSIDTAVEHGKTSQFMILDPLVTVCERNEESGCMMSLTGEIPSSCLKVIANHLEYNEKIRETYPDAIIERYNQDGLWLRRPMTSTTKDPHLRAMGLMTSIYGKRWTTWWSDDMLDLKSTWTPEARKKTWEIIRAECLSRLAQYNPRTDIGDRHRDTGTPFHIDDARHQLQRTPGYGAYRFDGHTGDVWDLKRNAIVYRFPDGLWPEQVEVEGRLWGWPRERLDAKRQEWGEVEYNRAIRCIPLSGTLDIFKAQYIELCKIAGRGMWPLYRTERLLDGRVTACWRPPINQNDLIVTGVDLAVKKRESADRTAFHTVEVLPNGKKLPLEIRAGHMEAPEIARQMIWILDRFPNHRGFRVEDNGAQDYLLQIAKNQDMMRAVGANDEHFRRLAVIAHTTTDRNKFDVTTGIRGMAVDFEQGLWIIPSDTSLQTGGLVQEWVSELLTFDPTSHTGDILMASWLATEEARRYKTRQGGTTWERFGVYAGGGG